MNSPNAENVQAWLVARLAELRGIEPRTIDVRERFSRYGLDSLSATRMLVELSAKLGRPLAPTLVWEYPTIESLAKYLTEASGSASKPTDVRVVAKGNDEPIAIVGLACRFPKAPNVDAFWKLLREGVDAITEVPRERWDLHALFDQDISAPGKMSTRWGGFLDQIDKFDPQFFGISPREAVQMDPQQRLALELAWEALEDAGIAPLGLKDSATGVFMGAMWSDYAKLVGGMDYIVQHTATGQDLSIVPARISYVLGLRGPSMAINTACSSALVAVHLAARSILSGESDLALAGGVNLIAAPHSTVMMSKFGAMAPDGRSKAFDARANGYVRGEGGGIIVLERLSRARALGHPIHAVILGSAVNNDGFSNGLTAPSPKAQEMVLRDAYANARVEPRLVQYIETHGTGTMLGDPIEAGAIGLALGVAHEAEKPLLIGSVKTNIGHLEAAAGVAGLIKVVLSLRNRAIPASLHFQKPNPHIPFDALHLRVQSAFGPWPDAGERAIAGVSSFGFGGTNCHIVLEGMPQSDTRLLAMSATSAEALADRASWLRKVASSAERRPPLSVLAAATAAHASSRPFRFAFTVRSYAELLQHLDALVAETARPGLSRGVARAEAPRLVFAFGGQGSQWLRMGRSLYREEPAFRASLIRIDRAMRPHLEGASMIEQLVGDDPAWLEDTARVQPGIFAIQVALADLLGSFGIVPAAVVGQSMGEVAAAYVAGCLDLDDAARVICARSRIVKRVSGRGAMAVVELGLDDAKAAIVDYHAALSVAVSSSPSSTVLSGEAAALDEVLQSLEAKGIFCRKVKVDYASHCPQMDPLREELLVALEGLRPHRSSIPFVSTVAAALVNGSELDANYWWRNLREPVLFAPAIDGLLGSGHEIFIDVNPHPLLVRAIEQNGTGRERMPLVLSAMRREEDESSVLRDLAGALYVRGAPVRFHKLAAIEAPPSSLLEDLGFDVSPTPSPEPEPVLMVLSAHRASALAERAGAMAAFLREKTLTRLDDVCFTATAGRSHLEFRSAVAAMSRGDLMLALDAIARGEGRIEISQGKAPTSGRRKLVFVFSGQGSQWVGMAQRLIVEQPVFRSALAYCDGIIWRYANFSILDELAAPEATSRLADTDVVQPALFAIQVAFATLFRSFGVAPDAVIGHSVGEVAAAYIAGVLDLEEAVRLVVWRGRIMQLATGLGKMAWVSLPADEAQTVIAGYRNRLAIAAINDPLSVVLSGETAALDPLVELLIQRGVECRSLRVNYAFHSPQMDPLRRELEQALGSVSARRPSITMYSTVSGRRITDEILDVGYWGRNVRETVRFSDAVAAALSDGYSMFLEITPHSVLASNIEECIAVARRDAFVAFTSRRHADERRSLLEALGALHVQGELIDWPLVHRAGGRVVSLPTYPWQRERCWYDETTLKQRAARMNREANISPMLGGVMGLSVLPTVHVWEQSLGVGSVPYLADHRVQNEAILPGAAFVEMALSAASQVYGRVPTVLEELSFERMLSLEQDERVVQVVLTEEEPGRASVQVSSRNLDDKTWVRHAIGRVRSDERVAGARISKERPRAIQARCKVNVASAAFYRSMAEIGLHYGKTFQGVEETWFGVDEALGRVVLPQGMASETGSYQVHPALLDACFQVLLGLQWALGLASQGTYVLSGVDRLRLHGPLGQDVWVHARLHLTDGNAGTLAGDISIIDGEGRLEAEIEGLRVKRMDSGKSSTASMLDDSVYAVEWRKKELASEPSRPKGPAGPGAWLLFVDDAGIGSSLSFLLLARGESCVRVRIGERFARLEAGLYEIDPTNPDHYQRALREAFGRDIVCRGVVHLYSVDAASWDETNIGTLERDMRRSSLSVLYLVQALARQGWRDMPRLWLVTRGAQSVLANGQPLSVAQSPVWGLGRTIAVEHPEFECTRIDLDAVRAPDEVSTLLREISMRDREDQVALRKEGRFVARLVKSTFEAAELAVATVAPEPPNGRPYRLEIREQGMLDQLAFRIGRRRAPSAGEVEIEVEAAGLNFLDVMKAMGIYPGLPPGPVLLGGECSGRVVGVGEGVENFVVGQEVIAAVWGSFASHVTTSAHFVVKKPAHLSFAEAAAIPLVFMTVYHALYRIARLRKGERILIHSATGGTGLAAIQLARAIGAEIYATAGSEDKRDYLRAMGIQHVMDSRSTVFAEEIMRTTGGRGLDVVLNTLTGEGRTKSLEVLGPYGRFVELSKRDIYDNGQLALTPFRRSLSYAAVDLAGMSAERPELFGALLQEVMELFDAGILQPVPTETFRTAELQDAFRRMAQARHIGKIAVTMKDEADLLVLPAETRAATIRDDGSYLITGGLGGLGLSLASWLVEKGARHLVLVSRSGRKDSAQKTLKALEEAGATVIVLKADVARATDVEAIFAEIERKMPPLRGIVHAAGVVDDRTLLDMTEEQFRRVLAPKVAGGYHLHVQSISSQLDFFVCYSSSSALLGAPGQGNYAAANAFLDGLAHTRKRMGLPGMSIQWGPFSDVGLAAAHENRGKRLAHRGVDSLSPAQGLSAFGRLLERPRAEVAIVRLSVHQWIEFYPQLAGVPFWSELQKDQPVDRPASSRGVSLRQLLEKRPAAERLGLLEKHILDQVSQVLRLDIARVDRLASFTSLGMDSLLSLELRNRLESNLGVRLTSTLLFTYPNPASLADHLLDRMSLNASRNSQPPSLPPQAARAAPTEPVAAPSITTKGASDSSPKLESLRTMSQAEAEALLEEELSRSEDYLS